MPALADLERWMEEQLPHELQELHSRVHATIQTYSAHLYEQIVDFTPTLEQIESSIPVIGPAIGHVATSSKQVLAAPPPPPKVPMYRSIVNHVMARADAITGSRRRTSIIAGVAVVGLTTAVLTREAWLPAKYVQRPRRVPRSRNGLRCDAIVVLGGDTPVGQALCHHLAAQGFIVLASVADDESKQSFDSLVPPSSRGYIKSIVLQLSSNVRADDLTFFVRSVAACKELRWPLTAAGDPYARPGSEVDIVAIVNALSYKAPGEARSAASASPSASATSFSSSSLVDVESMGKDMNQRAIVPLATITALLPLVTAPLRATKADTAVNALPQSSLILSIVNTGDASDSAAQALLAGMARLQKTAAGSPTPQRRNVVVTSLKVETSSLNTLFRSLFPSFVGGVAPSPTRPALTRNGSILGSDASTGRRSLDSSGRITESRPRMSASKSSFSGSSADVRSQRSAEVRVILQAASALLLETSVSGKRLRASYIARLPASAPAPRAVKQDGFETTLLSRAIGLIARPLSFAAHFVSGLGLGSLNLRSIGSSSCYYGTRNEANNRPAYGPGPGPASNTHSRSCIRERAAAQDTGATSASNAGTARNAGPAPKARRARPTSTASTSSEAARSSDSDESRSGRRQSGQDSSAPPSNPDLSSSGHLSSVPSSAFGDGSEEDHFIDSDFPGSSTDSPVIGNAEEGRFARAGGRDSVGDASISSDGDETALGARNYDASGATGSLATSQAEETPNASMHQDQTTASASQQAHSFAGADSMQARNGDDGTFADAGRRGISRSVNDRNAGSETPLGHSWVALGQSSLQQQGEADKRS